MQLGWAVLIARMIGQESFGQYSFGLALTQTVGVLADFGLNLFLIREVSQHPGQLKKYLSNVLSIKLITTLVVWAILAVIMTAGDYTSEIMIAIGIFAFANFILALNMTLISVFRANQDMRYEALSGIIFNLFNLAFSLIVVMSDLTLVGLAAAYLAASLFQAVYLWKAYIERWGVPKLGLDREFISLWKGRVVWLGLGGVFFFIYDRAPQLLLQFFGSDAQVGTYAAVYRMFVGISILPVVIGNVLLPQMSNLLTSGNNQHIAKLLRRVINGLLLVGIIGTLALYGAAGPIIKLLYGAKYASSIPVLKIMAWQLLFTFPGSVLGSLVIAVGEEKWYAIFMLMEVAISLSLGFWLIPQHGPAGAAIGTVAGTALVNLIIFAFLIQFYSPLFRIQPDHVSGQSMQEDENI